MQTKSLVEKPEQAKIKKPKKQRIKSAVLVTLTLILAVITGYYAGNLYVARTIAKTDYSQFTEENLIDDVAPLLKRVDKGELPSDFTASEAFVVAEYNLNNSEQFIKRETGSVSHKFGEQTVHSYRYKYNGKQYAEDISRSSMLSVAKKMEVSNGIIKMYSGKVTSKNTADWSSDYETINSAKLKELKGCDENQIIPYILSSKTVIEASSAKLVDNGVWEYTCTLNNSSAFIRYVKQVKYMSGLDSYPEFSKFVVTFRVDKDFNFVQIHTDEVYNIMYAGAVSVTCTCDLTQVYSFTETPKELF